MLTFRRAYFAAVVVVAALVVALWFGRELTFWLYGFDRSLIDSASAESFRAYRETARARAGLLRATEVADFALLALSLLAIRRRYLGVRELPPGVAIVGLVLALVIATVLLSLRLAPPPTILGLAGR